MIPNTFFQDCTVGKVVVGAWVLFTTFFFLYSVSYPILETTKLTSATQAGYNNGFQAAAGQAMASMSGNALQNGYNNGYGTAIMQLAQALSTQYSEGCQKAVPVTIGSGSVGIVSVDCLQKVAASASGQITAPAMKK